MIERLRQYVLADHKARWRNDSISMAISIAWYFLSIEAGVARVYAFRVSMGILIAVVALSTLWYSILHQRATLTVQIDTSKRALLARVAFALLVLIATGIGTPALEAAIIDKRLRKAFQGEPTRDNIEEAAQIVAEAKEHNLHASPQLISQIGKKVLNGAAKPELQEEALTAALLFASYRSNLSPGPKVQSAASLTPGSVSIKIACIDTYSPSFRVEVKGLLEKDTTSPTTPIFSGFGGFSRLEFPGCSRIMIQPVSQQAPLPLRDVDARNITFAEGAFSYDGGRLKLESVQFFRTSFNVPLAYAGNLNVQQFLAAVMTGEPVTLDL